MMNGDAGLSSVYVLAEKKNAEAGPKQDLWQQHLLGMLEGTSNVTYSTYRICNSCFQFWGRWVAGSWA